MIKDETETGLAREILKTGDSVEIIDMPMDKSTPTAIPTSTEPQTRKVTYLITADGPILNTTFGNMVNGKLCTEQANDVASPFAKEYTFDKWQFERDFRSLSVTAQAGEGTTTISCQINIDDVPGPVNTSTGPYAVVMCTK